MFASLDIQVPKRKNPLTHASGFLEALKQLNNRLVCDHGWENADQRSEQKLRLKQINIGPCLHP